MLKPYHIEITRLALSDEFGPQALEAIVAANLYQDRLLGQIGHDEFHFDGNAFKKSYQYIEEQRALTVSSLAASDAPSAWSAFGRLTHAVQDFYAHTNYIDLWLASRSQGNVPIASEIDPVVPDLIHHTALHSGRVYLPWEALYYFNLCRPLVLRLLPRDSHAWMNIDSPDEGPNFDYVFQAAVKRTKLEFEKTLREVSAELRRLFLDR